MADMANIKIPSNLGNPPKKHQAKFYIREAFVFSDVKRSSSI